LVLHVGQVGCIFVHLFIQSLQNKCVHLVILLHSNVKQIEHILDVLISVIVGINIELCSRFILGVFFDVGCRERRGGVPARDSPRPRRRGLPVRE
jgi:hypothetical protein